MDIVGLGMADGAEVRIHPTGKAVVRLSVQSQGQGHETTFAQIVAEEIGIPPRTSTSSTATPTTPRSASAPTAAAPPP
jgi:CO/xanthine dehydrogenase Mo-binding subunit